MAKNVLRTEALMKPIAQFSHGLRVGNEIHLGATAGTDRHRRLAGASPGLADARAQAGRMYENMKLALELLGGRLSDVVRLKTYVTDWRDLAACEEACAVHFGSSKLCGTTVGTWGFPLPQALIEADLTATAGQRTHQHVTVGGADIAQALAELAARMPVSEVVKVTVTLADVRDYEAFEERYRAIFEPPYPARTLTQAPLREAGWRIQVEAIAVPGGGKALGPRARAASSAAMLAGDHLFISAQTGEGDDAESQARAAVRRIRAILDEAGLQPADIVRTSNWLTDWRSYAAFNAGYGQLFEPPYPPRTTVIGSLAEPQALLQIEAQAHRQGRNATVLESHP